MKLVENWATMLYKAWSIRLAYFAGLVAVYLSLNPDQAKALINTLPEGPARVWAAIGIGLLVSTLAGGSRLVVQKNLTKPKPSTNEENQS